MPNRLSDSWLVQTANAELKKVLPRRAMVWLKRNVEARLVSRDLTRLAQIYGSDKWHKGYPALYERHLGARRRDVSTVLEIGVGAGPDPNRGGASLRMWRDYFPLARVYGIDIFKKSIQESRIVVLQGSQSDRSLMSHVAKQLGPIDLLIDDGSHLQEDIRTSFEVLFPYVAPGGFYVIEDVHTAYWQKYGGSAPGAPDTAIALIKQLLDGIHHTYFQKLNYSPTYADLHILAIHAYETIMFIEKRRPS